MSMDNLLITADLVSQLIKEQFPEYAHLPITEVEKQGHDNRTYRIGKDLLIRMPSADKYCLQVFKEQEILPKLAQYLHVKVPVPIKLGTPSKNYPYPFSIYRWLPGTSLNLLKLSDKEQGDLALSLAGFLLELQSIQLEGPAPSGGYRGAHISHYDQNTRQQISELSEVVDSDRALKLWNEACETKWDKKPVWVHGDIAIGNLLIHRGALAAVIDFGCSAVGDPACDLVIAYTYFSGRSREVFMNKMALDEATWLRARAWALWKATFHLCELPDKESHNAIDHRRVIAEVIGL